MNRYNSPMEYSDNVMNDIIVVDNKFNQFFSNVEVLLRSDLFKTS